MGRERFLKDGIENSVDVNVGNAEAYYTTYRLLKTREKRLQKELVNNSPTMQNSSFIFNYVAIMISLGTLIVSFRDEQWWNMKIIAYVIMFLAIFFFVSYYDILWKQMSKNKDRVKKEDELSELRYLISIMEDLVCFKVLVNETDVDNCYKNWRERKSKVNLREKAEL